MNQDSGGAPHITLGQPPPAGQRIGALWVLVATMPNGGEGIYGQKIGDFMFNVVAETLELRDAIEQYLRQRGSVQTARREGITLEWVEFYSGKRMEIT